MGKRLEKGTTSASLDRPSHGYPGNPLLLLKLQASSLGSTTPESRRQQLPVMRTPGKQFGTLKSPSGSGSKNNGPHPRRMLSPALVALGAD